MGNTWSRAGPADAQICKTKLLLFLAIEFWSGLLSSTVWQHATLSIRFYYYPHFTNEKNEAKTR